MKKKYYFSNENKNIIFRMKTKILVSLVTQVEVACFVFIHVRGREAGSNSIKNFLIVIRFDCNVCVGIIHVTFTLNFENRMNQ